MNYVTRLATNDDANTLAELRVIAMRPSLEAIGRFDATRARQRFLETFTATDTTIILSEEGSLLGFYVVRDEDTALKLDHLYVDPAQQGSGLGSRVVQNIQSLARQHQKPIRLGALRGSRSNQFYQRHGFQLVAEDIWDLYYEWTID